jgi:hypothetical protein
VLIVVALGLIPVYKDSTSLSSSSSSSGDALPLVEPPVRAATPAGLRGSSAASARTGARLLEINASEVRARFFSEGPSNMFAILDSIDGRIEGINLRIDQFPCLVNGTTSVNFTLDGWGDTPPLFTVQCVERLNNISFVLFGRTGNTTYLYERSTETMAAATVLRDGNGTTVRVEAWFSVGLTNLNGSHAVMHVLALPTADPPVFEMAVAGNGVGFCGAQLRSDNRNVYLIGSADGGATCAATDTSCTSALNVSSTLTNCSSSVTTMTLTPLGRQSYLGPEGTTLGASDYPGGSDNQIVLRADGNDTTLFGPLVVPDGLE